MRSDSIQIRSYSCLRETLALPQDGVFHDVDDCYTWLVEGEKATTNMSMAGSQAVVKEKGTERWKPQPFPPVLSGSSDGAGKVLIYTCVYVVG